MEGRGVPNPHGFLLARRVFLELVVGCGAAAASGRLHLHIGCSHFRHVTRFLVEADPLWQDAGKKKGDGKT